MQSRIRIVLTDLVRRAQGQKIRVMGVAASTIALVGLIALPTVDPDSGSDSDSSDQVVARDEGDGGPSSTVAPKGPSASDTSTTVAPEDPQAEEENRTDGSDPPGGSPPGGNETTTTSTQPPGPDVKTGNTRGVSDDLVKIGVTIPNLESVGHISDTYDLGDPQEQMESILDGWRRAGDLPVHGRDIEFVYRSYDIFTAEEKIAACKELIQDEKVFAVIGGQFFGEGAECVTERFDTPLIIQNGAVRNVYERSAPYYFTLKPAYADLFRNFVAWADQEGYLDDKTIGLYYQKDAESDVEAGIKQELERRGYEIAAEVSTEGAGAGSSEDQVAVQRFRQAGVDLVIPMVGGSNVANFTQLAQSQAYHPDYIDTDFETHTNDTTTELYQPDQWDGVPAMTTVRTGEVAAEMSLGNPTKDCVADYEHFSGKEVGHESPENAEYENLLMSCDLADVFYEGIRSAGRPLGHKTMIESLDQIREMSLARHGDLSFAPGQHWGVRNQRTIEWSQGCGCWRAHGQFRPFQS